MLSYLLRRALNLIPLILGVTLVFFLLFNFVGGQDSFLYNILPAKSRSADQIAEVKHRYGLDKPLVEQYFDLVRQVATFDFGRSESTKQKIGVLIARHVPNSALLTLPAFAMEILLALVFASLAAFYRGSWLDKGLTFLSVIGMSVSMLVLIILGQTLLAYEWKWFPISGWENGPGAVRYLLLPWLLWVVVSVGYDVRFFRTALVEEAEKDYVRTARAKGVPERRIIFRHILKNAMIPILTYVVIQIPFLLTGSILLERFFSIPGIGDLMVSAIFSYDLPVLKAVVIVYTLFFVGFTLVTDVLYALVDPRVRLN